MEFEELKARLDKLRDRLAEASGKWGGATLCAVTKTVDAEAANMAFDAGVRVIGENHAQEIVAKAPLLRSGLEVHMIGRLQSNKLKYLVDRVSMVQSLDDIRLARELGARMARAGKAMPVLAQVNIACESQKGGVSEADLREFLRQLSDTEGLTPRGLMAIMPYAEDPESVRPYFRRMRVLYDALRDEGWAFDTLSMGMSGDAIVAAEEGATMVRVGTALFGARVYNK